MKEHQYATREEVVQAIQSLSEADQLRIEAFAKMRAIKLPSQDAKDLLQTAIERSLGGSRRWPKPVSFVKYMRQTIRSISHEEYRKQKEGPVTLAAELASGEEDDNWLEQHAAAGDEVDPQRVAETQLLIEQVKSLFSSDAEVLAVLAGMMDGMTPEEICAEAGMSRTQYATAQRRIRRRLARAFPEKS